MGKTIVDLLYQDGVVPKKAPSSDGKEKYTSPHPNCPMPGNNEDRLQIWPGEGKGGRAWCRQCKWKGDAIQYLREFRGMSYKDACAYLEVDPGTPKDTNGTGGKQDPAKWEPKNYSEPSKQWQLKAEELVKEFYHNLYDPRYNAIIKYLREERGLTTETIKLYKLGYNPSLKKYSRADFGLPQKLNDENREISLWVPEGIVIPFIRNGSVLRIRVRLSKPQDKKRYHSVAGSSPAPLIFDHQRQDTAIVESDLDAILISQEAGDTVNAISLGTVSIRPDLRSMELIGRPGGTTLLALDSDSAGANEVFGWWMENLKAKRWPVPQGKDPGDTLKAGLSIKAWILAGLDRSPKQSGEYRDQTDRIYLDVSGDTRKYIPSTFDDGKIFDTVVGHARRKRYKVRFAPLNELPNGKHKGISSFFFGDARHILHVWSDGSACRVEAYGLSNVAPEALIQGLEKLADRHGLVLVYDDFKNTRKLVWKTPVPFERLKDLYKAMENIRGFVLEAGAHWI